jgi:NAD(P)-dependent dehydrogenase (short-subunit alcohol dehydrogenase family)
VPTVLITGATDGLGRALAVRAHAEGARVLAHGRDEARGQALVDELGGDRVRFLVADLASLAAVRGLADAVREEERLDVLISNAGIGSTLPGDGARMESEDGHELRFAVNYLAGFLLIRRLLPLLRASAPARVVQVASAGQMPIDFGDVMLERRYDGTRAYCQSKLAQVMLTRDLGDELAGTGVTATCLHPGTYMPTKMVTHAGVQPRTPLEAGVEATWRLAAGPSLDGVSGLYFDGTREAWPDPQADDPEARRRLRELSERLTGDA